MGCVFEAPGLPPVPHPVISWSSTQLTAAPERPGGPTLVQKRVRQNTPRYEILSWGVVLKPPGVPRDFQRAPRELG